MKKLLLYFSICCFLLMSVTFLAMPFDFEAYGYQVINIVIGVLFWVFLGLGVISQIALCCIYGKWLSENKKKKLNLKKRIGLIAFFQNLPAQLADIGFVLSIIGLAVSVILTDGIGYACYVFVALTVFTFCMHCILNGKVYYFINNENKILKDIQHKPSEDEKE